MLSESQNSSVPVPPSEHRLPEPLLTDILGELEGWERQGEAITKTYTFSGFKGAIAGAAASSLATTAPAS